MSLSGRVDSTFSDAGDIPSTPDDIGFSIVTPSYKQLEYLKCCVASVADQNAGCQVEHLVHDGGSGGEFTAWAASQQDADVVREKDDGMYDAINRGFRRARGGIVAWLNCDEQYLPGALRKVAEFFEKNPFVDIVFGDIVLVDEVMTPLAYRRAVLPTLGHIRYSHLSTFSAATFVRRKVLDDGHFLDTRWKTIADAVWIEELLSAGYKAAVLPEPLAVFGMLGSNLGQSALLFEERKQWEEDTASTSRWKKRWFVLEYRMERLRKGAYSLRHIEVAAFLPGAKKRIQQKRWISGRWTPARGQAADLKSKREGSMGGLPLKLRNTWVLAIHAVLAVSISFFVDGLVEGDAVKGPTIMLCSLLFLSFRSRLRDLVAASVLYGLASWYLLTERPFDVIVVRLLGFILASTLACFWAASLRSLEQWIRSVLTLIRRLDEPMILTDRRGYVTLVNHSASSRLNLADEGLVGKKIVALSLDSGGSISGKLDFYGDEERLPDGTMGLSLEDSATNLLTRAGVFVVGRGRFRLYAFTLRGKQAADHETVASGDV